MKHKIFLALAVFAFLPFFGSGPSQAQTLNTAVVGQPYYYPFYAPVGAYGAYAPIAYPGLYNNSNPAVSPGSYASSPFFLGAQVHRATGINTGPALNRAGFLIHAPTPVDIPY